MTDEEMAARLKHYVKQQKKRIKLEPIKWNQQQKEVSTEQFIDLLPEGDKSNG
jgi:hypothetical protein